MVFNVENLEDAMIRLGNLGNRDMLLIIWSGDTKEGKPIARAIRLVFPQKLDNELCRDIIFAINSKAWILAIIDEHKNVYKLKNPEKFTEKSCVECKGEKEKPKD